MFESEGDLLTNDCLKTEPFPKIHYSGSSRSCEKKMDSFSDDSDHEDDDDYNDDYNNPQSMAKEVVPEGGKSSFLPRLNHW